MEIFKDLSVQFVIITLPILIYETFWLTSQYRHNKKVNAILFSLLSSVASVGSIIFSIELDYGIVFHFAAIPIILTFYYVNVKVGIFTLIVPLLFMLNLFTSSMYDINDVVLIMLIVVIIIPSANNWGTYSKRKKVLLSSFFGFVYALIGLLMLLLNGSLKKEVIENDPAFFTILSFCYIMLIIMMVLNVYLKEYIIENTMIREEMQKSEKLYIISELAASVAHEVRNPLTVVRGFIQLIEHDEARTQREYLNLVLNELDRAENIISEYLNLARPQIEHSKKFCFSESLHEVCTIMSSFATLQGVYLKITIANDLFVLGDCNRLKQALMNVLKNGVEAVGETKGYISITAIKEGENVIVTIKDNGNGMSKEQIDRLGEPYYSLKEKGTGLGLMVTFSIIEAHNGKIKYKSNIGEGTTVTITLPAS